MCMNIRKIKKELKKTNDTKFIKIGLFSINRIRKWAKIKHYNSKSNMKILTKNFYYNGKFINK